MAKDAPQGSPSNSKLARMKNVAERTQKKQKRKADESALQAKREEMGKNKVFFSYQFPSEYMQIL
jgi:SWI/SNF-related matrix-associated actin-dependent regulator of chromatin subfamily A member 5